MRAVEDPALVQTLIDRGIPLEICPTSNDQTGAAPLPRCPVRPLLRKGAVVTVNTDNRTVSSTTIPHEFAALRRLGLTGQEEGRLLQHAAGAAFLPEGEKDKLRAAVRARIDKRGE